MSMMDRLTEARGEIPSLLNDVDGWQTLDVLYHPPRVERLWRPWKDGRLYLHRIHPCSLKDALLHPHPWPSAVSVETGGYWTLIGKEETDAWSPDRATRIWLSPGSSYEIDDPLVWHAVAPSERPALSVMVTGPLFENPSSGCHKPPSKQPPLTPEGKEDLLIAFRSFFVRTGF